MPFISTVHVCVRLSVVVCVCVATSVLFTAVCMCCVGALVYVIAPLLFVSNLALYGNMWPVIIYHDMCTLSIHFITIKQHYTCIKLMYI